MTWARREGLHELMDEPGLDPEEHRQALVFLRWMNKWTLARWILGREVRKCLREQGDSAPAGTGPPAGDSGRSVRSPRILDIATGGGDIPQYLLSRGIAGWALGVDRSRESLKLARVLSPGVTYIQADALRLPFADGTFDVAINNLFCHHLSKVECGRLFREMGRTARGWVVLDLERSRFLYAFVRVAVSFGRSRLARYDGPVSVLRAYRRSEMKAVLNGDQLAVGKIGRAICRWYVNGTRRNADRQ